MTSLSIITETALQDMYGDAGTNIENEKKAKMMAFLRERLIEYYKQKIIYYQTEVVFWMGEKNNRGEIPDEVVKSILADLEYEIRRKTF
jgi:hypothetical protein